MNMVSYELCVLNQLRDNIRARKIWVEGADRYRNPDQDLPAYFDERREKPTEPNLACSRMPGRSWRISVPAWRKSCDCWTRRCLGMIWSGCGRPGRTLSASRCLSASRGLQG